MNDLVQTSFRNHFANATPPAFRIRGYQRKGVIWLWLLRKIGLHGLLGDDMGLGKTLQVRVSRV